MKTNESYIYRFLNKNNEIIYIGRARNVYKRMEQHFSSNGHLPSNCYDEVVYVEYATLNSQIDMYIYEPYLINKYQPKYNTEYICENTNTTINLPEIKFNPYTRLIRIFKDVNNNNKENKIVNQKTLKTTQTKNDDNFKKRKINDNNIKDINLFQSKKVISLNRNKNICITKRDMLTWNYVYRNEYCTTTEIMDNYFDSSRTCQRRLKILEELNLISSHQPSPITEKRWYISQSNIETYNNISAS